MIRATSGTPEHKVDEPFDVWPERGAGTCPGRYRVLSARVGQARVKSPSELPVVERVGREDMRPPERPRLPEHLGSAVDRIEGDDRDAVLEREHQAVQPGGDDGVHAGDE